MNEFIVSVIYEGPLSDVQSDFRSIRSNGYPVLSTAQIKGILDITLATLERWSKSSLIHTK